MQPLELNVETSSRKAWTSEVTNCSSRARLVRCDIDGKQNPEGHFLERDTRHGRFRFPINDQVVGRCLLQYGEFSEGEVQLHRKFAKPGDVLVIAGANLGALVVPLSRVYRKVYTAEPNPMLQKILRANLEMNKVNNVEIFEGAVGDRNGRINFPNVPAHLPVNFGELRVGVGELSVPMIRLDDWIREPVSFIHLDVEGYEEGVLIGARNTIYKNRPYLYLETDYDVSRRKGMTDEVENYGYELLMHFALLYNEKNWDKRKENCWVSPDGKNIGSPMCFCIPHVVS